MTTAYTFVQLGAGLCRLGPRCCANEARGNGVIQPKRNGVIWAKHRESMIPIMQGKEMTKWSTCS